MALSRDQLSECTAVILCYHQGHSEEKKGKISIARTGKGGRVIAQNNLYW